MKVLAFIGDTMCFHEIENTLEAEQKFVGGLIEAVAITEEIDLICNEEFLLQGLEPRVVIDWGECLPTVICGDCFICRHNEHGEFESIRDEDMEVITEKVIHLDTEFSKMLAILLLVGGDK